jgi:hypothetical protein
MKDSLSPMMGHVIAHQVKDVFFGHHYSAKLNKEKGTRSKE